MSPDQNDESRDTSYEFFDEINKVRVIFDIDGPVELKNCDIVIDIDFLEVEIPTGQHWKFQLFDNIFPEQSSTSVQINEAQTKTSLIIVLFKQKPHTVWPKLHSLYSIPKTPQNGNGTTSARSDAFNSEQSIYELPSKKLLIEFSETFDSVQCILPIPHVTECQIEPTETNFTVLCHTNDEQFLRKHSIPSNMKVKIFLRVKERIVPSQCSHQLTSTGIVITLIKMSSSRTKWTRLEPSEHAEIDPETPLRITTPISPLNANINNLSSQTAIPLGYTPHHSSMTNDRQSDRLYSMSTDQNSFPYRGSTTSLMGYTGIYNPANSCFMNAAIQCLSNTRELRDYFLQSHHRREINRANPLGMKGAMAEELAAVIADLWGGYNQYIYANKLRSLVADRHQEFVGSGQHDAQELLNIVLDAVHEDLNRVIQKPLVPPVDDQNKPDEIVADEYWRGYLSRNDSIIVQLFTGQFKSKTKCPQCQKESVTFDPFTSISVPVPKRISVDTIVIYRDADKSPTKYRLLMPADSHVRELKHLLSVKCGLSSDKMFAYKVRSDSTGELLKDDDRVSNSGYSWSSFDMIYITEILTSAECNNEPIHVFTFTQRVFKSHDYISACAYCRAPPNPLNTSKWCIHCYRVCYCNEICEKLNADNHRQQCASQSAENYTNVGYPFVVSLPESKLTCKKVFEQIYLYAKRTVDIYIERTQCTRPSFTYSDDFDDVEQENNSDDSFSDIEKIDWETIKTTLASSDSWSICRLGDYFVQKKENKRQNYQENDRKEKLLKTASEESITIVDESDSNSSIDDFDMLDDIFGRQLLFRLMPQTSSISSHSVTPIVEAGDEGDRILRQYQTFYIDWFTDNRNDAPLRIASSRNLYGINELVDDESVRNTINTEQDVTLTQCLQMFIEPETLGPNDKWYCPHCKEHIQAEKTMSIWRLPPILIIQLKRFKYNQYSSYGYVSSSREKIETTVKFPIHDLDIAPYCSSLNATNTDELDRSKTRYDLFGIINHRGTAWFGHYTSNARLLSFNDSAKSEIGWRQFDDDRVTAVANDKDLLRSDAYVLFYRHRHSNVKLSTENNNEIL